MFRNFNFITLCRLRIMPQIFHFEKLSKNIWNCLNFVLFDLLIFVIFPFRIRKICFDRIIRSSCLRSDHLDRFDLINFVSNNLCCGGQDLNLWQPSLLCIWKNLRGWNNLTHCQISLILIFYCLQVISHFHFVYLSFFSRIFNVKWNLLQMMQLCLQTLSIV